MDAIDVDLLYYATRESASSYAIVQEGGFVLSPTPPARLGFRIGAHFSLPHDDWEVGISFLHYHGRTTEEELNGPFIPTQGHPLRLAEASAQSVRDRFRLHLGFLDVDLSTRWSVSRYLSLSPQVGLRATGIRHKVRVGYREIGPFMEEDLSMKNKFWGVGPLVGGTLLFSFFEGLGIYARGAWSFLYGSFYVHQDEDETGVKGVGMKLFDCYFQSLTGIDGSIGFEGETCFGSLLFRGRVGFDTYLVYDQNVFLQFPSGASPGLFFNHLGDLALYGLSVRLGLSF